MWASFPRRRGDVPDRGDPERGGGAIRTGVTVGYSAEYRDRETNMPLLASLARLRAGEGPPGVLVDDGVDAAGAADPAANPFRRDSAARPLEPVHLAVGDRRRELPVLGRRVRPPGAARPVGRPPFRQSGRAIG